MAQVPVLNNYISGTWEKSKSDKTQEILNPATNKSISRVPLSKSSEVDQAANVSREAFKQWRQVPVTDRIQYLFKLKQLLEENLDSIAQTITEESGKTIHESRGELRRAIENVEVACGAPNLMQGYNNEDIASGIDEIMIRQPIGVSAIIAPFNFPAMIPFWFMPYAIAAGNTCIINHRSEYRIPCIKFLS